MSKLKICLARVRHPRGESGQASEMMTTHCSHIDGQKTWMGAIRMVNLVLDEEAYKQPSVQSVDMRYSGGPGFGSFEGSADAGAANWWYPRPQK